MNGKITIASVCYFSFLFFIQFNCLQMTHMAAEGTKAGKTMGPHRPITSSKFPQIHPLRLLLHLCLTVGAPDQTIPAVSRSPRHPLVWAWASRRALLPMRNCWWLLMAFLMLTSLVKAVLDTCTKEYYRMVKRSQLNNWRLEVDRANANSKQRLKSSAVSTINIWFHWSDIACPGARGFLFMSSFRTTH